jgi:hypothetical protein
MEKLIHDDEINEKFSDYPFLDAPKGYWNVAKDGYDGYVQTSIRDMTIYHRNNCMQLLKNSYIPTCSDDIILHLLNQKIEELKIDTEDYEN